MKLLNQKNNLNYQSNYGKIFDEFLERGCLLYHHSCSSGENRLANKVKTVGVGLLPG